MILLEFAAQGIRGVAPAGGRATLRPGYNVVAAEGPALRRLLEALFYPDPRDADALPRPTGAAAGVSLRAGLTLVGNDRVTYRLVRDFQAAAQLHRFDAEKRSFALVASDLPEIAAFLQKTAGVPPSRRLSALLSLTAAELPSKQGGPGMGGGAAVAQPARSGLSRDQAARRITQLRAELGKAKIAEKLQAELDENQHRAFKVDELLKGATQAEEGLAKAQAARADLDPLAAALASLGDVDARLAQYQKASAKREEAIARVESERAALDDAEGSGAPRKFWEDPSFWAGIGGASCWRPCSPSWAPAAPSAISWSWTSPPSAGRPGSPSAGSDRWRAGSGAPGAGAWWRTGRRRSRRSTPRTPPTCRRP